MEGTHLFNLAALNTIHNSNTPQNVKRDLSIKYKVLTDLTSFVGKIKNRDKSSKALKSVEIPILKQRLSYPEEEY